MRKRLGDQKKFSKQINFADFTRHLESVGDSDGIQLVCQSDCDATI